MDHPDQVAGHVARTVLGDATTPEPLAAGAWSTAYALTDGGRAAVLRISRYGGDFAKDEAVSTVGGDLLPVPGLDRLLRHPRALGRRGPERRVAGRTGLTV
jgi:hypothetical protein